MVTDGVTGDFYLNTTSFTLYGPKTDNAWSVGLMLKGADGNANVRTFKLNVYDYKWTTYNNEQGTFDKSIYYSTGFPALTQDVFENGFVLVYFHIRGDQTPLPQTFLHSNGNFLKEHYSITSRDSKYRLRLQTRLVCPLNTGNANEVISVRTKAYRIKVVTGKIAEQLSMNKDNQVEFNRLLKDLEE
jgi:hypothetical protein